MQFPAKGSGGSGRGESRPSPPSISRPKGGGAIRGIGEKFAANPVNGTGTLTVPIFASPGRGGFGPRLELSYDSGAGNGPFGLGFSLSLPAIVRSTDRRLPRYLDRMEPDTYVLLGSEDLVPLLPQVEWKGDLDNEPYTIERYRPRTEGLFARIERWTHVSNGDTHWRSVTRDNVTTLYGKDRASRIMEAGDGGANRIFSWLICESHNDKGDSIVYEYRSEDSDGIDLAQPHERNRTDASRSTNRYVKRIKYGRRTSRLAEARPADEGWLFEVVFDYDEDHYGELNEDERPEKAKERSLVRVKGLSESTRKWTSRLDPFSSYRAGFEVRTYRLCRRVMMIHHFPGELGRDDYLVRSTDFTYDENPIASLMTSVTQSGYVVWADDVYLRRSLPPLELEYSKAVVQEEVRELEDESIQNLPYGVDGAVYQWVDLDGEGLPGVLTEQAGAWFFKRNLGDGKLGPLEAVGLKPSLAALREGRQQFIDLAGDGNLDLVDFDGPIAGFYERTSDRSWAGFRAFESLPKLAWSDSSLKLVDLTGDGHADALISEDGALRWYPSLGEAGFGEAERIPPSIDEESGPRVVFGHPEQLVHFADMTGDGMSDLVLISRNGGDISYYPSLGYGRFGARVTMANAPFFDPPDLFDPRSIRLADIDGSGVTDIIYQGHDGVRLYSNQSGNSWAEPKVLKECPAAENVSAVTVVDLRGNGTACLVWSSPLPDDARRPLRFIDLMGGKKPHLLTVVKNNLGAETRMSYAPSTRFYLADEIAGRPWITRLPFPVHVVERVETYDRISGNRFVNRFAYHHGHYDGVEREPRGFWMVERWDTEEIGEVSDEATSSEATNLDEASRVPPVRTRTWYHTGAPSFDVDPGHRLAHEYHGAPARGAPDFAPRFKAFLSTLPNTVLPLEALDSHEELEGWRALKGSILRQEVSALVDGGDDTRLYTVSDHGYEIELLQRREGNRHAVLFVHPREQIDYHYEAILDDPRVSHQMTLELDEFGNVERSAAIAYPRAFSPDRQREQGHTHVTLTVDRFANHDEEADWYRIGVPIESRTYELVKPPARSPRLGVDEIRELFAVLLPADRSEPDDAKMVPYEAWSWREGWNPSDEPGGPVNSRLRLIEHVRTLYRDDDLTGPRPLGETDSLALPYETYKLAFTESLLTGSFRRGQEDLLPDPSSVLEGKATDRGGYVKLDEDVRWWVPSGQTSYSPVPDDSPTPFAQDDAYARAHFYTPQAETDPFGQCTRLSYAHDLLLVRTEDAVGSVVLAEYDRRVLQPRLITDPNGNRTEVAFDALGMVEGTAVTAKEQEPDGRRKGDSLDGFETDPTLAQLQSWIERPIERAGDLLGSASTRILYDLERFQRCGQPPFAASLERETHLSDPGGQQSRIQIRLVYSDGFGREIQAKVRAEAGEAPQRAPEIVLPSGDRAPGPLVLADGKPTLVRTPSRWVSKGRVVYNNKNKPAKQGEPFPTGTHLYEEEPQVTLTGATSILFYDPLDRVIATLRPDHSYEKVVFGPWSQTSWDVNDTLHPTARFDPRNPAAPPDGRFDPKNDPDVGHLFERLPETAYLPTWLDLRLDAAKALARWPDADLDGVARPENSSIRAAEKEAAEKALRHCATPTTIHFDGLGRSILTVADNGIGSDGNDLLFETRVVLDIEGNQRRVIDARGRTVMQYDYDMLGNWIRQMSADAGQRWMLGDVSGKPIRKWDGRGHAFRTEYDPLRRVTRSFVTGADPEDRARAILFELAVYGEAHPRAASQNLRGQVFMLLDGAGLLTHEAYDFKGNLLRTTRRLAKVYKMAIDWSPVDAVLAEMATATLDLDALETAVGPVLEKERFAAATRYDALNRSVQVVAPHEAEAGAKLDVIQPAYSEANLLERIDVWLRQAAEPASQLDAETADVHAVLNIDYNARGQRTSIEYGNGATTTYEYDSETFRLTHLQTVRATFPSEQKLVQDLRYAYDPTGNIASIVDSAQQTIYFANIVVVPHTKYVYDALYRLIEATGREHLGQAGGAPMPTSPTDAPRVGLRHPNDGAAMGRYHEEYVYDEVNNILSLRHRGTDPNHPGWKRCYQYAIDSNRLLSTGSPKDASNPDGPCLVEYAATPSYAEHYEYDDHGNMTRMPHLPLIEWDFQDQLSATQSQVVGDGIADKAHYVYDVAGRRVRKVTARPDGSLRRERIYLGGFEIYREYDGQGAKIRLERETLPAMDDERRIAAIEMTTINTQTRIANPTYLVRYQLPNHLGSACVELDEDARIISYEEYFPYGSSSYECSASETRAAKRYRFNSKERDEESQLCYCEFRYYSTWLGQWISPDPAGTRGGLNLYAFASRNPVVYVDMTGKTPTLPPPVVSGPNPVAPPPGIPKLPGPPVGPSAPIGWRLPPVSPATRVAAAGANISVGEALLVVGALLAVGYLMATTDYTYRGASGESGIPLEPRDAGVDEPPMTAPGGGSHDPVDAPGAQKPSQIDAPGGKPIQPAIAPGQPRTRPIKVPGPARGLEQKLHLAARWKVGDPHWAPTQSGREPSWSTVRRRFWKNEAFNAFLGQYSSTDLALMRRGRPYIDPYSGKPMELEHIVPQRSGDPNRHRLLIPYSPLEHSFHDRHRHEKDPNGKIFKTKLYDHRP